MTGTAELLAGWQAMLPSLVVVGVAVLAMLVDLVWRDPDADGAAAVGVLGLGAAMVVTLALWGGSPVRGLAGTLVLDRFALFVQPLHPNVAARAFYWRRGAAAIEVNEEDHTFTGSEGPEAEFAARSLQFGVTLLLLLIAVNVSILVYARTATRTGEIAVRTALGASRPRVVAQLFVEALVPALIAAAAGLGLLAVAFRLLRGYIRTSSDRVFYWMQNQLPETLRLNLEATALARDQAAESVGEQFTLYTAGQVLVPAERSLTPDDLALLRLDDERLLRRRVFRREQLDLLGLVVLDGGFALEGVEVVLEEGFFLELHLPRRLGRPEPHFVHRHRHPLRSRAVHVSGHQLERRVLVRGPAVVVDGDPAGEVELRIIGREHGDVVVGAVMVERCREACRELDEEMAGAFGRIPFGHSHLQAGEALDGGELHVARGQKGGVRRFAFLGHHRLHQESECHERGRYDPHHSIAHIA